MPDPEMLQDCPRCFADHTARAFVTYLASPNEVQLETEWADDLPESLVGFVCTECGTVIGTIDIDPDGAAMGSSISDRFRIEEELE